MRPSRSERRSRRAPLVVTGTALGLAGVLSFRSVPATVALSTVPTSSTTAPSTVAGASPPTTVPTTTATTTPASHSSTPTTVATTPPSTSSTRSATGAVVNYYFGLVSVKVTVTGSKIDAITIASLNDGGNPRSQYIDHLALPMLIKQAMAAQSANIQGVSGATYTTAGFATSLANALKGLGVA